jgi:hypothetical protein
VLLEQIQRDTAGEWSGISSAAFEKFGQFGVGVHGGRIASMYDITGYGPGEEAGRIRFDVRPRTFSRTSSASRSPVAPGSEARRDRPLRRHLSLP